MDTTSGIFLRCERWLLKLELNKKIDLEILRRGKPVKVTTEIKEQPVDYPTARVAPRQQQPQPQNPQVPDDQAN